MQRVQLRHFPWSDIRLPSSSCETYATLRLIDCIRGTQNLKKVELPADDVPAGR